MRIDGQNSVCVNLSAVSCYNKECTAVQRLVDMEEMDGFSISRIPFFVHYVVFCRGVFVFAGVEMSLLRLDFSKKAL